MRKRFFIRNEQARDNIQAATDKKKSGSTGFSKTLQEYSNNLDVKKKAEWYERIKMLYEKGELDYRIENAVSDIWYMPVLSQNQIEKYDILQKSRYFYALKTVERYIYSLPV